MQRFHAVGQPRPKIRSSTRLPGVTRPLARMVIGRVIVFGTVPELGMRSNGISGCITQGKAVITQITQIKAGITRKETSFGLSAAAGKFCSMSAFHTLFPCNPCLNLCNLVHLPCFAVDLRPVAGRRQQRITRAEPNAITPWGLAFRSGVRSPHNVDDTPHAGGSMPGKRMPFAPEQQIRVRFDPYQRQTRIESPRSGLRSENARFGGELRGRTGKRQWPLQFMALPTLS